MSKISVPISHASAMKLDRLAKLLKRDKGEMVAEVLDAYLETQQWQIERHPDDYDPSAVYKEVDEAALAKGEGMVLEVGAEDE
ncbi:MAG: hypothetical protein D6E12_15355 [Desulfovibrio sp.]|nr:MAG: hypothetical protein D6E12_15355 [Desulfovibrio sp.]